MRHLNRLLAAIAKRLGVPAIHIDLPDRRPRKRKAPQLAVIGETSARLDSPLVQDLVERSKRLTGRDDIVATQTAGGGVRVGPAPFQMTAAEKAAAIASAEVLRVELEAIVRARHKGTRKFGR